MLCADKTITVINCSYDADADDDVYTCHTFSGCSWYEQQIASASSTGMTWAKHYKIRIPETAAAGVKFYTPNEWQALTASERAQGFTLAAGDVLLLGSVTDVATSNFAALCANNSTATVLGYHYNIRAASPHWYVEGA